MGHAPDPVPFPITSGLFPKVNRETAAAANGKLKPPAQLFFPVPFPPPAFIDPLFIVDLLNFKLLLLLMKRA